MEQKDEFQVAVELTEPVQIAAASNGNKSGDTWDNLQTMFAKMGWKLLTVLPDGKFALLAMSRKTLLRSIYRLNLPVQPFHLYGKAHQLLITQHAINYSLLSNKEDQKVRFAWLVHSDFVVRQLPHVADSTAKNAKLLQYYGPDVAFYFAWLEFFTQSLAVPAFTGSLLWLYQLYAGALDSPAIAIFTVLLALWAGALLSVWRHISISLSRKWGLWDLYDPVEDEESLRLRAKSDSSLWRSFLSLAATGATCLLLLRIALYSVALYFRFNDTQRSDSWAEKYGVCVLYSIVPVVAPLLFEPLLQQLNAFERHSSPTSAKEALIYKRCLLHFVNRHVALLYLLFVKRDLVALRDLLASILLVGQVSNNAVELGGPVLRKLFLKQSSATVATSDASNRRERLAAKLRDEVHKDAYDLDEDFLEMTLQFSTVAMFSAAFPLAPFLAWLNNVFEAGVDLRKMEMCRRAAAKFGLSQSRVARDGGLGAWFSCQQLIALGALFVNAACLSLLSSQLIDAVRVAASGGGESQLLLLGVPLPSALARLLQQLVTALSAAELNPYGARIGEEALRLVLLLVVEHLLLLLRSLIVFAIDQGAARDEAIAYGEHRLRVHLEACGQRTTALRQRLSGREVPVSGFAAGDAPTRCEATFAEYRASPLAPRRDARSAFQQLTASQRRAVLASERERLRSEYAAVAQSGSFGFEPMSASILLLLPTLLAYCHCPLWLSLPAGLSFLANKQAEKDLRDRRTAAGLLADPALRALIREMLKTGAVPANDSPLPAATVDDRDSLRWLDLALSALWPYLAAALETTLLAALEPVLESSRPAVLSQLRLERCWLGPHAPRLLAVRTLAPDADAEPSDASAPGRARSVKIEIDLLWNAAPRIALKVATMIPPVPLTIALEDLTLSPTTLRLELLALNETALPCFSLLALAFTKPPRLDFSLKLAQLDVTKLGVAQQFSVERVLRDLVGSLLESMLVLPNKLLVPLSAQPDLVEQEQQRQKERTAGVLRLTIVSADDLKAANLLGDSDPYVTVRRAAEDGGSLPATPLLHRTRTIKGTRKPVWSPAFVVDAADKAPANSSGASVECIDLVVRDEASDVFELAVFDEDYVTGQDSSLGRAVLRVSDFASTRGGPRTLALPLTLPESGALLNAASGVASGVASGARGLKSLASSALSSSGSATTVSPASASPTRSQSSRATGDGRKGQLLVVVEYIALAGGLGESGTEPTGDGGGADTEAGDASDADSYGGDDDDDALSPEEAALCRLNDSDLQLLGEELRLDQRRWFSTVGVEAACAAPPVGRDDHSEMDVTTRESFSIASPYDPKPPRPALQKQPSLFALFSQGEATVANAAKTAEEPTVMGVNPMRSRGAPGPALPPSEEPDIAAEAPASRSAQLQALRQNATEAVTAPARAASPLRPQLSRALSSRVQGGVVTVSMLRVKGISPAQSQGFFGTYNAILRPFVVVTLDLRADSSNSLVSYATAYKKGDLSPNFDETFHLILRNAREMGASIVLVVNDKQKRRGQTLPDREIGRVTVPLLDLLDLRRPAEQDMALDVSHASDARIGANASISFRLAWAAAAK